MSEFILPLLILDRICFGTHKEEAAIRQEFLNILTADPSLASTLSMSHGDHQRAVSSVFMVIETLNYWVERETEDRYKSSRSTGSSNNRRKQSSSKVKEDVTDASSWPADKTISRIEDLVSTIPLSAQARAAANTGMHARSLRLLEMAGRKRVVEEVYESSLDQQKTNKNVAQYGTSFQSSRALVGNYDGLNLMKDALARLDDCETMASIGEDFLIGNPLQQVRDSIRRKEASGDFEGALQDYERALQLQNVENRDSSLQSGILTCLLELGQFESVLNQVRGLIRIGRSGNEDQNSVTSFAVEAAWRLGRWETLSDMVEKDSSSSGIDTGFQTMHQISVGKAMLGLHRKDRDMVTSALERSREALMHGLSSAARESYSRSYSNIVALQCVRELENASDILCLEINTDPSSLDEIAHSTANEGWAWTGRLNLLSSHGSSSVISTRVALARLCGEPVLEGSLFLSIGNRARKNGLYSIAENFFSKAEAAFTSIPTNELAKSPTKIGDLLDVTRESVAKLKHESGESALALKILGHQSVQNAYDRMLTEFDNLDALKNIAVNHERERVRNLSGSILLAKDDEKTLTDRFARRLLRLTQWTVDGGLKGGSEITRRYRIMHKLAPEWEKGKVNLSIHNFALLCFAFRI
jgi:serine/threonine-protein kinase ATR